MKADSSTEKPLSSWKEISAYLGCDERTCLRWEKKFKLPVHRAGTKPSKSLVFAYKEELDEWLKRRKPGDPLAENPEGLKPSSLSKRWLFLLAVIPGVVLVVFILMSLTGKSARGGQNEPFDFKIENSLLIITNRNKTELWRYDSGLQSLYGEDSYRQHFGHRHIGNDSDSYLPWLQINDINDDGHTEVLFVAKTQDDSPQSALHCIDSRGRKLWTYEPGRDMTFGTRHFSADYALDCAFVLDMGRPGPQKILVMARHKPNFPSYVAILSSKGETIGEYWNTGRFSDCALVDIDDDGNHALVLVGTNNEYGKGFLAAIDPDFVWGGSPQAADYRCPNLIPGSELFYILFPRTIVDRLEFAPREVISFVDLLKHGRLIAIAFNSRIIFELNARMEIDAVIVSDAFREKFRKFQEAGKIPPGNLNETALSENLAKSVVYYDGERWTTTPSRNKKNLFIYLQKEGRKNR